MLLQLNLYEHEKGLSIVSLQTANHTEASGLLKLEDITRKSTASRIACERVFSKIQPKSIIRDDNNAYNDAQRDYKGQNTCWVRSEL